MWSLFLLTLVVLVCNSPAAVLSSVAHQSENALPIVTNWYAPFLSGGGYSSEAISYAVELVDRVEGHRFGLVQFAEQMNSEFDSGLPPQVGETIHRGLALGGMIRKARVNVIAVCHSTPDVWVPSAFSGWDVHAPCPPPEAVFRIGRTMFETDRVPLDWVDRCNKMDEIWVPSAFHVESFARSGVDASKLVQVPEAVDVHFFDPEKYKKGELPGVAENDFVFVSIFKWETRKGWDILLRAFFEEFSPEEEVSLFIKTSPFHDDSELTFPERILKFAKEHVGLEPSLVPAFSVVDFGIPQEDLARMYRSADAFVLPHRGEGWGRPHAEAMAMGLPVLATNWSGSTEFMTPENSFPIEVDRLSVERNETAPDGSVLVHNWAEASVVDLRKKMRHVFTDREDARAKGARARQDMIDKYSPRVVAKLIMQRLQAAGVNTLTTDARSSVKEEL